MSLADLTKRLAKAAIDNSPTILTSVAAIGAVTTAYLAGKASFEASDVIRLKEGLDYRNEEDRREPREVIKDRFELVWKLYIPTVTTGVATLACIISANRVASRRYVGLAAATTIIERSFDEYKAKVVEKIGVNKERAIRDSIAQDRVERTDPKDRQVIIVSGVQQLCLDSHSGRYFRSDIETLRSIENDLRDLVNNDNYATLTDYYNAIGLLPTKDSGEIGWKVGGRRFELDFSTTLTDDRQVVLVVDLVASPIREPYSFP